MKKAAIVLLSAAMIFTLVGCGGPEVEETSEETTEKTTEETSEVESDDEEEEETKDTSDKKVDTVISVSGSVVPAGEDIIGGYSLEDLETMSSEEQEKHGIVVIAGDGSGGYSMMDGSSDETVSYTSETSD